MNTKYIPITLAAVQPPIPESEGHKKALLEAGSGIVDEYDLDPAKEMQVLAGTERWCTFDVQAKVERARGCWVEIKEKEEKSLDGEGGEEKNWFPKKLGLWQVGAWCEEMDWTLGDVGEWK
jgi:hypothetical protein